MKKASNRLAHLEDALPLKAYGYDLSTYTIALEAWRRGLTVKFYRKTIKGKNRIRYVISNGEKEHHFSLSKGDLVSKEQNSICKDKSLTKNYLIKEGVSVPKGKTFGAEIKDEEIISYAEELGYPLVLKPSNSTLARGVIVNIKNSFFMKDALIEVRQKGNFSDVIVEQYIQGEEYRIYVLGSKVLGVYKRVPANITGDGKNTIEKLIEIKNKERKKNPHLHKRPIVMDDDMLRLLKEKGYDPNSIPEKGEIVYLREISNLPLGGDSKDCTDELSTENKNIAIQAAKAIGLVQCGVDMIVDKISGVGMILEINARAHIGAHLFPAIGTSRDIPKAIIDFYFPETVNSSKAVSNSYYFNYDAVVDILKSRMGIEIVVPHVPGEMLEAKQYNVSGTVQGVGYRKWVLKKASQYRMNGYVKNLKNGDVQIVAAGKDKELEKFEKIIYKQRPSKAKVKEVEQKKWEKPTVMGFEIKE